MLLDNRECRVPAVPHAEDDKTVDDDVLKMDPQSKPRPRYILTFNLALQSYYCLLIFLGFTEYICEKLSGDEHVLLNLYIFLF